MPAIQKSNQIIPELYAEAVQGAFSSKTAFLGADSVALGIVKVDGSFPTADPKKIGDAVSVPYFGSLGEFVQRTDGTAATATSMSMTKETGNIDCGTLGFEMTQWAASVPVPGQDPYSEAARQVLAAAERYGDNNVIKAAAAGNNQLVIDKFSLTTPRNLDYDLLTDALGMWGDFGSLAEVAAIAVHSKVYIDLLKLKDAVGRPLLVMPTAADAPPLFWGKPLIVSDRLQKDNSGLTGVTATGTTPPAITLTQTTNREGGTGPVRPINLQIKCTTGGARGTWLFQFSIDGGATFTAVDSSTSAATVALVDNLDPSKGLLGVTLNIAAGTASTDNVWNAQSILKHTTLLLKKGSIAFWYNKLYAGVLQSVPVPLNDSVVYASHLYSVAHRYVRMPGQPFPGVVKIRHNAGGL